MVSENSLAAFLVLMLGKSSPTDKPPEPPRPEMTAPAGPAERAQDAGSGAPSSNRSAAPGQPAAAQGDDLNARRNRLYRRLETGRDRND